MSGINLNSILNLTDEEVKNSKIELHMTEGRGGKPYIDRWLKSDEKDKNNGTVDCSYWPWYGKQKNFNIGQTVFSFVNMNTDEWLFVSAATITGIPEDDRASVSILDRYKQLFGRLIIKYHKGPKFSRYVFRLQGLIEDCVVKEILPCQYTGKRFEGYDKVLLDYMDLLDVFTGKIMPTYYDALSKVTGVYCLTDGKTGKLYIGSASGEGGVAQRWGNYLDSGHGGNKKLIELYKREGKEYFEKNFSFCLIEYFGLSYDPGKIREREAFWKQCFDTVEKGYNDNY